MFQVVKVVGLCFNSLPLNFLRIIRYALESNPMLVIN